MCASTYDCELGLIQTINQYLQYPNATNNWYTDHVIFGKQAEGSKGTSFANKRAESRSKVLNNCNPSYPD